MEKAFTDVETERTIAAKMELLRERATYPKFANLAAAFGILAGMPNSGLQFVIDFLSMTIQGNNVPSKPIRRTGTRSFVAGNGPLVTFWRWYFKVKLN